MIETLKGTDLRLMFSSTGKADDERNDDGLPSWLMGANERKLFRKTTVVRLGWSALLSCPLRDRGLVDW